MFTWTYTGPRIPNLSLMWPAKPNELPNPALTKAEKFFKTVIFLNKISHGELMKVQIKYDVLFKRSLICLFSFFSHSELFYTS